MEEAKTRNLEGNIETQTTDNILVLVGNQNEKYQQKQSPIKP